MPDENERKKEARSFVACLCLAVEWTKEHDPITIALFTLNFEQGWFGQATGVALEDTPAAPSHPLHVTGNPRAWDAFVQGFCARRAWEQDGKPALEHPRQFKQKKANYEG